MRFSQKIYLIMLVLFALIFNIGMYTVMHYSYKEGYKNAKQQAASESHFVITSIYNDFHDIDELDKLSYEKIETIFNEYQKYYGEQGIVMELYEGSTRLYGTVWNIEGERKELELDLNTQNILTRTVGGEPYLFVSGRLQGDYSRYMMVLTFSLNSLETTRENMLSFIIKLDVVFMFTFAAFLAFILMKLFAPLRLLSIATDTISEGDYSKKIKLRGKNEFAELANKFNIMSERIEEKIEDIRLEGEGRQKLVDNMAHELRTPLTSISGYAEYMKMAEIEEEEKQEVLDYIVAESRRLSKLGNTLLNIAEFRENEIEVKELWIEELKDFIYRTFDHKLKEKSVILNFVGNATIMTGNKEMVDLLFSNLIENAVRACNDGGHVTVSFEQQIHLVIKITDDGIGIAEEELQKIAEPFYRVDKARSRKDGGVGLGVTLCQQIVLCHGAKMHYESEIGKGTTVCIFWK